MRGTIYSRSVANVGQVFLPETGDLAAPKVRAAVVSALGANAFIAAVPGKKIRVLAYRLQVRNAAAGTVTIRFFDTQPTPTQIADSPQWDFQAREGVAVVAPRGAWEFESPIGQGIQVELSAAAPVMAHVIYVEV